MTAEAVCTGWSINSRVPSSTSSKHQREQELGRILPSSRYNIVANPTANAKGKEVGVLLNSCWPNMYCWPSPIDDHHTPSSAHHLNSGQQKLGRICTSWHPPIQLSNTIKQTGQSNNSRVHLRVYCRCKTKRKVALLLNTCCPKLYHWPFQMMTTTLQIMHTN